MEEYGNIRDHHQFIIIIIIITYVIRVTIIISLTKDLDAGTQITQNADRYQPYTDIPHRLIFGGWAPGVAYIKKY